MPRKPSVTVCGLPSGFVSVRPRSSKRGRSWAMIGTDTVCACPSRTKSTSTRWPTLSWPIAAPIWRVEFEGMWKPTLYLSPHTGELLSRRHDLWRGFDFFWMLHIMDYETRDNMNNALLKVATWMMVATSLSGAWLLIFSFRRKRRVRLTASGHALLKRAYPLWCEAHAALEQEFCDAATLRALLQQVVNRAQTRDETAR